MICKNCKFYDDKNRICRNMKARYVGCEECYNANPKPTNADRIRAMTDEELANFIFPLGSCPIVADGLPFNESADCADDCEKCWLDWLKKEVESDG